MKLWPERFVEHAPEPCEQYKPVQVRFTVRQKLTPARRLRNQVRAAILVHKLEERKLALTPHKPSLQDCIQDLIDAALDQPNPTSRLTETLNAVLRWTQHPAKARPEK